MAQDDHTSNHNTPPAISSVSMIPGRGNSSSHLVVGAINKGKDVIRTEGEDGCGRSEGKITTPHMVAAAGYGRSGGCRRNRELQITTERERRKRMSEMFTQLHGLLPTLPDKVDKSSIVMETIKCIKSLEETLSELENRKMEMQLAQGKVSAATNVGVSSLVATQAPTALVAPSSVVLPGAGIPPRTEGAVTTASTSVTLQTWSGPNVVLSMSGNDAYINLYVARRPGVLTMVMDVLEKHNIDVVMSGISSDNDRSMFTIHARINGASNQFRHIVPSEEIYKLAVSEMMVCLSEQ